MRRVLLVANETLGAPAVRDRIRALVGSDTAEVFVVAPALTSSRLAYVAGEVDEAIEEARKRLDQTLAALRESGFKASGEVGDSDPILAMQDALRRFPADEIVISTHPPGRSRWLEQDVVERAATETSLPVTHVLVDVERGGVEVKDVEHTAPSPADKPPTMTPYGLPRMTPREIAAIVVGIVGTIVLGILAAVCAGDVSNGGMSAGCALRIGLAIAAFAMTVFHVLALLVFSSIRYRGRWQSFAANTLLAGVPLAIVVSALVD